MHGQLQELLPGLKNEEELNKLIQGFINKASRNS